MKMKHSHNSRQWQYWRRLFVSAVTSDHGYKIESLHPYILHPLHPYIQCTVVLECAIIWWGWILICYPGCISKHICDSGKSFLWGLFRVKQDGSPFIFVEGDGQSWDGGPAVDLASGCSYGQPQGGDPKSRNYICANFPLIDSKSTLIVHHYCRRILSQRSTKL